VKAHYLQAATDDDRSPGMLVADKIAADVVIEPQAQRPSEGTHRRWNLGVGHVDDEFVEVLAGEARVFDDSVLVAKLWSLRGSAELGERPR